MGRTQKLAGSSRVVTSLEKVLGGGDGEEVTSGVRNAVAQLCASWYCWLHRQPEELLRQAVEKEATRRKHRDAATSSTSTWVVDMRMVPVSFDIVNIRCVHFPVSQLYSNQK